MRQSKHVASWAILALLLWCGTLWLAVGAYNNWSMKTRVGVLSEDGAGLEYGEWLVNFLLVLIAAILMGFGAIFCSFRVRRRLRCRRAGGAAQPARATDAASRRR